jgi:transcriptional regulator with XRE-family HTH domain
MDSIGQRLKAARESRGWSASQVASALNTKLQVVEDMEADRFERMAAPIYAKGFIRLYAEHVGLDVKPLVDAYVERYQAPAARGRRGRLPKPPPLRSASILAPRRPLTPGPASVTEESDAAPAPMSVPGRPPREPWRLPVLRLPRFSLKIPPRALRAGAIGLAVLLLLVLAGAGLNRAVQSGTLRRAEASLSLVRPPPPPYGAP